MAPFWGPLCGPKNKQVGFVGLWFGGNANVQDVAALRLKHCCACFAIILFERWLVNKKVSPAKIQVVFVTPRGMNTVGNDALRGQRLYSHTRDFNFQTAIPASTSVGIVGGALSSLQAKTRIMRELSPACATFTSPAMLVGRREPFARLAISSFVLSQFI